MNASEKGAYQAIYYRHRDWVTSVAYRLTHDQGASEDVLQDTFAYFFGKFPDFNLTCRLKTFLYPVIRSFSLNSIRNHKRIDYHPDPASLAHEMIPAEQYAYQMEDVDYALARLTEKQREILLLRFADDFTLHEIARAMDLPLGTVKTTLYTVLSGLRNDPQLRKIFRGGKVI